jgi:hypothetical protein
MHIYVTVVTANAALARIIKDLFQNASIANLSRIDSLESVNEQLYSERMSQKIISRSRDYGYAVADAILIGHERMEVIRHTLIIFLLIIFRL